MSEPVDANAIRRHYRSVRPVYDALADLHGNLTVAKFGQYGVYTTRQNDDPETCDEWPIVGRPRTFDRGVDDLIDGAARGGFDGSGDRGDRTLYAMTSYNAPEHLDQWYRARPREEKGVEWDIDGQNPMPGHGVTRALAAWGDIDLADDVKSRRPELTDDEIETVEAAIEAYIDEYASLYGSRDAVYALDSVGGLYVMGAPEAILPAVSSLRDDADGRQRFIEAFIDRSNAYLEDAEQRVNDRVDGAADLHDPTG